MFPQYISLNPYRAEQYFVLWKNGSYRYVADPHITEAIRPHVEEYVKDIARRKNMTFALTTGGVTKRTIVPDPIEQQKSDILQLQQENLELQAKVAKASITAAKTTSKVAVGVGALAAVTLCSVM